MFNIRYFYKYIYKKNNKILFNIKKFMSKNELNFDLVNIINFEFTQKDISELFSINCMRDKKFHCKRNIKMTEFKIIFSCLLT